MVEREWVVQYNRLVARQRSHGVALRNMRAYTRYSILTYRNRFLTYRNRFLTYRNRSCTYLQYFQSIFRNPANPHRGVIDGLADQVFNQIIQINDQISTLLSTHPNLLYYKALFGM